MKLLFTSIYTTSIFLLFMLGSCKKYLDVPLPVNTVAGDGAFNTDQTCAATLNSVYASLLNPSLFDGNAGTSYSLGLYADELKYYGTIFSSQALYTNAVTPAIGGVTTFWSSFYKQLYSLNQAIQGIQANNGLTYKNQWLGEAYFMRGLFYFYLTNLYGDAALVTTPDYLVNNGLKRSAQADVYKQIIADLKQAQNLLDDKYHNDGGTVVTGRGRPNRMAATALLARTYLYTKDWANAEIQAGSVIANSTTYQLPALNKVFLLNSPEIVWGLTPMGGTLYPYQVQDAVIFPMPNGTKPGLTNVYSVTLTDSMKNAFEPGDGRYSNWVGQDTVAANGTTPQAIYYYARKYQAKGVFTAAQESVVLFRLAEQYLIRAEARAMQNKLSGDGAIGDLNVIRSRAGLTPTAATSQTDVLNAIQRERRVELFCEQGHRFFDLRRTGALDALMTKLVPLKGGAGWRPELAYWPIPVTDLQNDLNLTQTPGY